MGPRAHCPFCVERTGSLGSRPFGRHVSVDYDRGTYYCYRCNARGDLTNRMARKLEVDPLPIGRSKLDRRDVHEEETPALPPYAYTTFADGGVILARYERYLRSRGVSRRALDALGVGVCSGDVAWFMRGALAFPVRDESYPGWMYRRDVGEYRSPGVSASKALYCGDGLLASGDDPLFVVEGPIDRLRLWPARAVATLGKDISETQLDRLAAYRGPVVIAYDGDAWVDCKVTAQQLSLRGHENASWVKIAPGLDPGDLGKKVLHLERVEV